MRPKRILLLLLVAALYSGCGKEVPVPTEVVRPVVTVSVPAPTPVVTRSFSGLVQNAEGTGIAFEVGGRVTEVIAKEGVVYKKGDVLAKLDTTEFTNQLSAAKAQMTEAQQGLRRAQQLFETGNASKSQLEAAISAEQSATSAFKSAEKRVSDSTLTMPYPGTIGSVEIDPQMVVGAGQTVATIQGEGGMEFEIGVPADLMESLSVGMEATVQLGSIPGESFGARIDSISPQVARNTTYPVTLTLNQEDPRIREGLDGEAYLELANAEGNVVVIPSECVASLPGGDRYVWVVGDFIEEGIASVGRRIVTTGKLRNGGEIEILKGLEPGETVVSRGVHRLEENQKVSLLEK